MLDLQRLAREADFSVFEDRAYAGESPVTHRLREFARLVLEEAAKVCDQKARDRDGFTAEQWTAEDLAVAIRELLPQDPP